MRIGVFDSGIGGLTVLKKLIDKYPNCEYIYYGDTLNAPFGNKSIEDLKKISTNIIDYLIKNEVDIIVVACGTISSNLIEYLRSTYNIPIFDIISGVVEYINTSNYKNIGVICTEQTKNSQVFQSKINKNVDIVPCRNLATMIEKNDIENIDLYLKEKLSDLIDKDILVLGCTHYPLIMNTIEKYTNSKILDMADYLNINIKDETDFKLELYFSKEDYILINNIKMILKDYEYVLKTK